MLAGIIYFLIANALTSWLGAIFFTGDRKKQMLVLSDKRWKSFFIMFIGYCVIFYIIYLNQK